jgi:hypothetical protein
MRTLASGDRPAGGRDDQPGCRAGGGVELWRNIIREASRDMAYKPFDADALIDASAPLLQLRIEPEYRAAIKANLKTASKMAALVERVKLGDEAEPAPVFRA